MEHQLTVTLPPQPVHLDADPARLTQVIGNLLHNAGKFTDKGGRIWLTVEADGEQAVIAVRDNGVGIAPEHHHAPLRRCSRRSTRRSSGRTAALGIGLTLVKTLVEMHGGKVEVQQRRARTRQRVHRPAAGWRRRQPRLPPPPAAASRYGAGAAAS